MTTAREIMTGGVECAQVNETVTEAARKMRDLGVGALPICGEDNRLKGMITDRDIVVKVVAAGDQPVVAGHLSCARLSTALSAVSTSASSMQASGVVWCWLATRRSGIRPATRGRVSHGPLRGRCVGMRLVFFVDDVATEIDEYATTRLSRAASR